MVTSETVCSDLVTSTLEPTESFIASPPSTLINISGFLLNVFSKRIFFSGENIIGRVKRECGQISVISIHSISGSIIGPPAESEYAVEPVGVLNTAPSARYEPIIFPSAYILKSQMLEYAAETETSLSAVSYTHLRAHET